MPAGNIKSQVRPSTGTPDQRSRYQITLPRMAKLWPSGNELPGFKTAMLAFERANWAVGMKVLSCFALKLGFAPDFFTECARSARRPNTRARCGFCITCR